MKKRNRLFVCLVAGVLILAVSATAAFGSVNGYSKYKEAVKSLALKSDNFTANGAIKATYDGKEIFNIKEDYAMDGHNEYSHSVRQVPDGQASAGTQYENYMATIDGVRTTFDVDDNVYYEYNGYPTEGDTAASNLLGIDADDEMMNRLVNFTEIAADTVVGELKNNFVQVGKENGSTLYQVEIAKNQVPSLVNAGLSLFAYSVSQSNANCYMVNYEDYTALLLNKYEKATGETLSADFKENYSNGYTEEWYQANKALADKVDEFNSQNWEEDYYTVLDEKNGGVVYVKTDGSYDYYPDYKTYANARPDEAYEEGDIENYVGQDMTLEKVLCNFGVDDKGNLTSNSVEITFTTVDQDGGSHQLVITGDVTLKDYGTTTIQPLDVGSREKCTEE